MKQIMGETTVDSGIGGIPSDLQELAQDYANYLQVDASKERQAFYNSIEEMLTKLDEFGGLVDTVRSDTSLCVVKNVHEIQTKCEEIKQIFRRIDQLEKFVQIVRDNVSTMEECVNKAENEMGSFSSFKKLFSSLVGSKKPSSETRLEFKPPDIFVTEQYLKPVSGVEVPVSGIEVTVSGEEVPVSGVEQPVPGVKPLVSDVEITQDKDVSKEVTVESPSNVETGKT